MTTNGLDATLARLDVVKDAMTVRRVFGEAYEIDGTTIIPVAKIGGGGGGGGGEGTGAQNGSSSGTGGGMGFGVGARPVGVYVVKDGEVTWQPAVDVMRIVVGGQLLALAAILALRSILRRRH
ncbi:MAG TPA: spore germination protein GerW family protein [Acidimicrobiia bacterium]|nr:spore germination protein GerW family protein [Acidimicrobiia bacterium]